MKNMIALTGIGYDIHRFAEIPRPLMLGGVHIPSSRGLDGHSDADVLCHAIADALLGAAGLPDIGYWFPPGDPACKDIPSLDIVAKAVSLIRERGGFPPRLEIAAIGQATARALARHGVAPALQPDYEFTSEALLALPRFQRVTGQHILIVRGEGGRELLAEGSSQS